MLKKLNPFNSKSKNQKNQNDPSKEIDKNLKIINREQQQTLQLLLLGAGGSGKSTILKQMERIYNQEQWEQDYDDTMSLVHRNIIEDMCDLCKQFISLRASQDLNSKFSKSITPQLEQIILKYTKVVVRIDLELEAGMARDFAKLWATDAFKYVYTIRKNSHIMDNTPYFLDNVTRYAVDKYEPTFDDYVRLRNQTTGLILQKKRFEVRPENKSSSKNAAHWIFNVVDVGGQRNERKKWFRVFDGIDFVIYVMSLSAYDQFLWEDNQQRCWDESYALFTQTINHEAFVRTDFIIFLNKSDLFTQKIREISFMEYINGSKNNQNPFGNYPKFESMSNSNNMFKSQSIDSMPGFDESKSEEFDEQNAHSVEHVIQWTQRRFMNIFLQANSSVRQSKAKMMSARNCHFHVTCATDSAKMTKVISVIQMEMLRKKLEQANLL